MVDLDVKLLGYLSESVANMTLGIHHDSHYCAGLSFCVDPVGNYGFVAVSAFFLLEYAHQQVCYSDKCRGMLEHLFIVSIIVYIGNTH